MTRPAATTDQKQYFVHIRFAHRTWGKIPGNPEGHGMFVKSLRVYPL
jgi:hypothetical protein